MITNSITQGQERIKGPDDDGVLSKVPSSALEDLVAEVTRASAAKNAGQRVEARDSTIESRADLRAASANEAAKVDPPRSLSMDLSKDTARQWAELDAGDFSRLRAPARQAAALDSIAANSRELPDYADQLKQRSPVLFEAAAKVNESYLREEGQRIAEQNRLDRENIEAARRSALSAVIDADALARVATVRTRQSQAAATLLEAGGAPTVESRTAQERSGPTPERAGSSAVDDARNRARRESSTPAQPRLEAVREDGKRVLKRPILEEELPGELKRRFVVSAEKTGLLDRGRTEFSFRGGDRDGQAAFADIGKQLSTQLNDREVVRSMVEVAVTKGWKELTVAGTDEFRRQAWLESRLNGLDVDGYEPRDADQKRLAELQASRDKGATNTISTNDRDKTGPQEPLEVLRARMAKAVFNDGSVLTVDEEKMIRQAHDAGGAKTEASLRQQASTRLDQDVKTVRVMDGDELRNLARLYDGPAAIDTDKRVRAVLETAANRHGVQVNPELKNDNEVSKPNRGGRQIDGDNLNPREAQTLETMRGVLKTKQYSAEFVDATMLDLERRMRSQRVHIGTVVDHGAAPYQWNKIKNPSYFVTLRTSTGHETVWGALLSHALKEGNVKVGDTAVLTNVGKSPVVVEERELDSNGKVRGYLRPAELNAWTAQTIDKVSTRELSELKERTTRRTPTMRVFDVNAPRAPAARTDFQVPVRDAIGRDPRDR
jgi:hypothetical protein